MGVGVGVGLPPKVRIPEARTGRSVPGASGLCLREEQRKGIL